MQSKQFRKRPVLVRAYRHCGRNPIFINTLEGKMRADPGDWIITGVKGEQYPCKPDIFSATYEPVKSTPSPRRSLSQQS